MTGTQLCTAVLCCAALCTAGSASVFPRSKPPAKKLLHVNLLGAQSDVRLAVTVLQGLVNREKPRIYITQDPGWHGPTGIPKLIEGLKAKGYAFEEVTDPVSLFTRFAKNVKGAVIYEPNLEDNPAAAHKLNALTLYCALNDAVPVTESLNARLKLRVFLDARGKLGTAREAYDWAYKVLWPRASHNVLGFTCPTHIVLRDYLVAHKIMPIWISQEMNEEDANLCWRFLAEVKPNSPVMGCWGGYGEKPAGRIGEPEFQQKASASGKFVLVSDGCVNLTVHSGLTYRRPPGPKRRATPALDRTKAYVCMNFTDGDNVQYVQMYFRTGQWWECPDRGKVAISWSMNPAMSELMPDVLEHYQRTSSPLDELVCSGNGLGLASPPIYAKECPDRERVLGDYMRLTSSAMKAAGMANAHVGETSGISCSREDFDKWAAGVASLEGILGDYGAVPGIDETNCMFFVSRGVPVLRWLVAAGNRYPDGKSAQELADAIKARTPKARPAFMHVMMINWFMSPTVAVDAMKLLGPEYVPVLPAEIFALMRAHGGIAVGTTVPSK